MAKRKYNSPVFLSVSPLIYQDKSEDGTTGSGNTDYTGSSLDDLLSDNGLTSSQMELIFGSSNWASIAESWVTGFNASDSTTYYLLIDWLLANDKI